FAGDTRGMGREVDIPDPTASQAHQGVPVAGKRKLEDDTQHAIVVILDLAVEALSAVEHQRIDGFDHRRPLVADVARGWVLERGLLQGASAENLAKLVQVDLLADVELNQDEDRPMNGGFAARHWFGQGFRYDDRGIGVANHEFWAFPVEF